MIWLSTSGIVVALAVIMLLWVVPRASRRAPANGSRRQLASVGRTAEDIFLSAKVLFNEETARGTGAAVPSASGKAEVYASTSTGSLEPLGGVEFAESAASAAVNVQQRQEEFADDKTQLLYTTDAAESAEDADLWEEATMREDANAQQQGAHDTELYDEPYDEDLYAPEPDLDSAPGAELADGEADAPAHWEVTANSQPSGSRIGRSIPEVNIDAETAGQDPSAADTDSQPRSGTHHQGTGRAEESRGEAPSAAAVRGPALHELSSTEEVPEVQESMLGGPVPPGMTVHTGRAVLLGVALLAFVAALGFALMAFSGMLSWVWPVAALLVAVATGGLLRYLAISGAKKPAASRRESSSAPVSEQAEVIASAEHGSRESETAGADPAANTRRTKGTRPAPARIAAAGSAARQGGSRTQGHRAPAAEHRSERVAGRERPAGEGVQEESSRPRREPAPLRRHTPARRSASAQGARVAASPGVQREPDVQGAARRSAVEREPVRARTSQLPAIRRGGRGSHLPPQLRPLAHRDEPMLFDIQTETPQAPSASAQATQPADSAVSSAPVTAAPTQSAPSQSDSAEAAQPTAPVPTQPPAAPARPEAAAKTGRVPQQNLSGASSFERSGSFDADATAPITDGISTANLAQRAAAARAQATRAAEAAQQVQREAAERARRRARQLNLQNPYPQQDPVQQPSSDTAEHTTVPLGHGATPDVPPVQPPVPHTPVPSTIDESDLDSLDDDVSPVFEPQLGTLGSGFEDTSTQGIRLGPGAMPMFKATSNTWEPVELPKPLHTLHQKKDKDAKGKGKTGE
ncbi:phage holin family protein [Rothia aeria]|nr:phage holin family protein [Rothia aeria]